MKNLKSGKTRFFVVLSIVLALFATAHASEFSGDVYVDTVSKYLWRGFKLYHGVAVQPGADLNFGSLSVGFWGSYHPATGDLAELDTTVSFSDTLPGADIVGLSAGFTAYTFPNLVNPFNYTVEVFSGISLDTALAPALTFYYDAYQGFGGYLDFGISQDFDLAPVTLSAGSTAGYSFGQWAVEKSLTVLTGTLGIGTEVSGIGISLSGTGQLALDDQYENDAYGSLGFSYGF